MTPHEEWLYKSANDLKAAKKLSEGDPVLDAAIYHTHQCAEKAFKAYLSFRDQPIQKTHNLLTLLEYCTRLDESFSTLMQAAIAINPYATFFRYPDEVLIPDLEDVFEAIQFAETIERFVERIIDSK